MTAGPSGVSAGASVGVLLAGLLALSACVPFGTVTTVPGVEGIVVSAEDGSPVSGAPVYLQESGTSEVTDGEGRFTFEPRTERRLLKVLLPASHLAWFRVEARPAGPQPLSGHVWAPSLGSSHGYDSLEVLMVVSDATREPETDLSGCTDPLSRYAVHSLRVAERMDALLETEAFRRHYTGQRADVLEMSLQRDLRAAEGACAAVEPVVDSLYQASLDRR